MPIASIRASVLAIPFKQAFRHASAERDETQTLWVQAQGAGGHTGHGESCPREYVTAENLAGAQAFVERHESEWRARIGDVPGLRAWVAAHQADIDANPSAWTAVELAILDLLGREASCSVERLLGLPELSGRFRYTAVLGDASPQAFELQLQAYRKAGFAQFKIKLAGDAARDAAKVAALKAAGIEPSQVRADANNLWRSADEAIAHLRALDYAFMACEEPLGAGDYAGMSQLADVLGCRIILDESLLRADQLQPLAGRPQGWIGNLRVSKMGGLLRSLALADEARRLGFSLIIGAHVGETSLLTRAALTVAQAARDVLLAQEGAFGTHLLARDIVDPPLMFGAGGVLDVASFGLTGSPGFGLKLSGTSAGG